MARIKLVIELDDGDAYDNEVAGILRSTPDAGRKELITSSILYFVRSPSFRLADKMDKVLQALEGGAQISHQHRDKAPTIHHTSGPLQPPPPLPWRREQIASASSTAITIPKESTDGADDIFASLATEFR